MHQVTPPASISNHIPSHYDDEISLSELLISIWEGKKLIALITAFALLIGLVYAFITPNRGEISLRLDPLTDAQFLAYSPLNAIKQGKQAFFPITKSYLFELFKQELADPKKWNQAITKYDLINRQDFKTDQDFELATAALLNRFKLVAPTPSDSKSRDKKEFWSINYQGDFSDQELAVISDVLAISSDNVRSFLQKKFKLSTALYTRNQKYELENLKDAIHNQIAMYDQKTRNQLAYLHEQAKIARALDIKKNTIEAQTFGVGVNGAVLADIKSDDSLYLHGYFSIEKEIDLLKKRTIKEAHIPELVALFNREREIEQSKIVDRAKLAFDSTPIQTGNFHPADYDVLAANINQKNIKLIAVILSIFLGLMLGLFALLIKNALREKATTEMELERAFQPTLHQQQN
jgi:LPS O-antigen subunit length determinant protein (WzzB/FepE family)